MSYKWTIRRLFIFLSPPSRSAQRKAAHARRHNCIIFASTQACTSARVCARMVGCIIDCIIDRFRSRRQLDGPASPNAGLPLSCKTAPHALEWTRAQINHQRRATMAANWKHANVRRSCCTCMYVVPNEAFRRLTTTRTEPTHKVRREIATSRAARVLSGAMTSNRHGPHFSEHQRGVWRTNKQRPNGHDGTSGRALIKTHFMQIRNINPISGTHARKRTCSLPVRSDIVCGLIVGIHL